VTTLVGRLTPFASNERVFQSQERINAWMAIITDQSKVDEKVADDAP
jgi:glycerophosphodiester phosphodiesterase